jgi:hypothetical protein
MLFRTFSLHKIIPALDMEGLNKVGEGTQKIVGRQ